MGQYSIRINDQYRICFIWRDHDAYEILREEFLKPMGMSAYELAKQRWFQILASTTSFWNAVELRRTPPFVSPGSSGRPSSSDGTCKAPMRTRVKAERGSELERIEPLKSGEARGGRKCTVPELRFDGRARPPRTYLFRFGRGHR